MRAKIMLAVAGVVLGLLVFVWAFQGRSRQALFEGLLAAMPESSREEVYARLASHASTLWDTVPEPLVGRLAKRGIEVEHKGTTVCTNQAGFRSHAEFVPKQPGTFRIVCLGDSFVMGTGGAERDRYSDQLADFFRDNDLRVDGREVEVLALGLGGWTMLQEVTYLRSRLSDYSPDLIALLTVPNDITTSMGVTGFGTFTHAFSPEERSWGSGRFHDQAAQAFGNTAYTALSRSGCPSGEALWRKSVEALNRLISLQHGLGGHVLLGILDWPTKTGGVGSSSFTKQCQYWFGQLEVAAPWYVTSYFPSSETRLPHDGHPNRRGHGILTNHLLRMMRQLKFIEIEERLLPALHPELSCGYSQQVTKTEYERVCAPFRARLPEQIDFVDMDRKGSMALLGGLVPSLDGDRSAPWGSVRTGFVLMAKQPGRSTAAVTLDVPPLPELYPFTLSGSANGGEATELHLASPEEAGEYELRIEAEPTSLGLVEVILETSSYFTTIRDARMRSYELLSARLDE